MTGTQAGPGLAELRVGCVRGKSTALATRSRSPLGLLVPRREGRSVWAYLSSLGGGMVAGDVVRIAIDLDAGARCFFGTQSSSKIYRNPSQRPCAQLLEAKIGADALLALLPDPVQCFAGAQYEQRQKFVMEGGANLILADSLSAGRRARGEQWQFRSYSSRNEIYRDGRPLLIDAMELSNDPAAASRRFRVGQFGCLATVVLLGPLLKPHARAALEAIGGEPVSRGAETVVAASPLHEGAILRIGSPSAEQAARAMQRWLGFLPALLHDDPLARKW
jgi:urease accessory protein